MEEQPPEILLFEDKSLREKILPHLHKTYFVVIKQVHYIIPITLIILLSGILLFCVVRISLGGNGTQYVRNTNEYQVSPFVGIPTMMNRSDVVDYLIKLVNDNSKYLKLNSSLGNISTRGEYSVTVHDCQTNDFIRIREYTEGYGEGTATIDIKDNSKIRHVACNFPYWPHGSDFANAHQKCENDYHACKSGKSSRETRIELDHFPEFKVCSDIYKHYPWAYDKSRADFPVISNVRRWWWVYYYPGVVSTGSRFEFSVTLKYDNETAATNELSPPRSGEISLRLFGVNDGLGDFDPVVQADFVSTYGVLAKHMATAADCA